jgi:hypothetical protein
MQNTELLIVIAAGTYGDHFDLKGQIAYRYGMKLYSVEFLQTVPTMNRLLLNKLIFAYLVNKFSTYYDSECLLLLFARDDRRTVLIAS